MKKMTKVLAFLLVFCMTFGMASNAFTQKQSTVKAAEDNFYRIVHLDAARKYFSPANIKKIIDTSAAAGYNQLELYLSDNQGFRFALDDMNVKTLTGKEYDLTPALGDGYSDGSKYPDGSGKYLKQDEMTELIGYANKKGIEIVPCINVPGHMGAILEAFPDFRYGKSKSSIDLGNTEAVAFALAIVEKYAAYFETQGVKYFNIGADEYANDLGTMGFEGIYKNGTYTKFVDFLNEAAKIVDNHGMTPRAFNDGIYYNNDTKYSIDKNIQVCYWSSGWSGYNVASAQTIASKGHKMINTHGDYYWVLGNSGWQCSPDKAAGFQYKSFQGGTIDNPSGAMFCIWCDVGNKDGADEGTAVASNTAATITAFGATLPGSDSTNPTEPTDPIPPTEPDNPEQKAETITLNIGESAARIQEGVDNTGKVDRKELDESIASVAVSKKEIPALSGYELVANGAAGIVPGEKYLIVSGNSGSPYALTNTGGGTQVTVSNGVIKNVNNSAVFTLEKNGTGYNLKDSNGRYLYPNATYNWFKWSYDLRSGQNSGNAVSISGNNSVQISRRITSSSSSTTVYIGYSNTSFSSNAIASNLYLFKEVNETASANTEITFKGNKVGTTYITVGDTRYTINVVAEDISKVNPLTVEYWITNVKVTADNANSKDIKVTDSTVYSEKGAAIATLLPKTGTGNANSVVTFWKATCLASNNKQTTGAGVDKTRSGNDFAYIRYWNGNWAYSSDGKNWTNVVFGDQMVAYYLQVTEVTEEVTTEVVDWGVVPHTDYNASAFVLVDYAVKYESGERTPNNFPVNGKTMAFHCDSNDKNTVHQDMNGTYRTIGMIKAEETANYEVYMITLTPNSDDVKTTVAKNANQANSYSYNGTEKVVWVDDEAHLGDFADASTHHQDYSVGGEAIVPQLNIYKNQGMLVTYYVRAKVTEDSLSVHYVDKTANQEFYNYNIAVKSGTVFNQNIGLANPWKANLANGNVINLQNKTQTVSADLGTMPEIGAQYRYSDYTCVEVICSEDGKEVYLYYTFNNTHSFIVDFGLPLTITQEDLGLSGGWDSSSVAGAKYGTAETNKANGTITYTPNTVLEGVETLQLTLKEQGSNPVTSTIYIYPATTVYYEEGFAVKDAAKGTGFQKTEIAGKHENVYGYDANAGLNQVGPSNGTQATSNTYGDKAEFTFTGTGVDIYANCTPETGRLFIQVKNKAGKTVKMVQVQTALLNGTTDSTAGQEVNGYNVPVTSLDLVDRDTYSVVITHMKKDAETDEDVVNLDGFRVYGTLNADTEAYVNDKEANPTFVELRNTVLDALNADEVSDSVYADQIARDALAQVYSTAGAANGAVLLSANGYKTTDVKDLLDNGPKNELYIRPGQTVVFNVSAANKGNVQIGLKALNAMVKCTVDGMGKDLAASTDMFYSLDVTAGREKTVTITNNGGGILSITKLKFPGTAGTDKASYFGDLTEEDLIPALLSLGFKQESSATYADAAVNINLVDYTGKVLAATSLTANGESGANATFTAEEVKAAAEQKLPKEYAIADTAKIADQTVKYGEASDINVLIGKVATLTVTYKKNGKIVGTATLTGVQTSKDSKHIFSASEIQDAAPKGVGTVKESESKVKYGASGTSVVQIK